MSERPPPGFDRFRHRGADLVRQPEVLLATVARALTKLVSAEGVGRAMSRVADDLRTMAELVRAWVRGEYRDVSTSSLALIAAGLLYFVVPTDLVPDFIVALGLLDDAAVIGYVVGAVRSELLAFRDWRQARNPDDDTSTQGPPTSPPRRNTSDTIADENREADA